jgi:hypothetical protein
MSLCPCAAERWSGVSSPMLVVCTLAPREISISTILVWPPLAAQCSGENWWSSLKKNTPIIKYYAMQSMNPILSIDAIRNMQHVLKHHMSLICLTQTRHIILLRIHIINESS